MPVPQVQVGNDNQGALVALAQGIGAQKSRLFGDVTQAVGTAANIAQTVYQDVREYDATRYKTNSEFLEKSGYNPDSGKFDIALLNAKAVHDPTLSQAMRDNISYQRTGSFGKDLTTLKDTNSVMGSLFPAGWEKDQTLAAFASKAGGQMDAADQATANELARARSDTNVMTMAGQLAGAFSIPKTSDVQSQNDAAAQAEAQKNAVAVPGGGFNMQQVAPGAQPATAPAAAPAQQAQYNPSLQYGNAPGGSATLPQPQGQAAIGAAGPAPESGGLTGTIEERWKAMTPIQRNEALRTGSMGGTALPVNAEGRLPNKAKANVIAGDSPTMPPAKIDALNAAEPLKIKKAYTMGAVAADKMLNPTGDKAIGNNITTAWSGINETSATPQAIAAARNLLNLGASTTDEQVKTAFLGMKTGIAHTVLDNGVNKGAWTIPVDKNGSSTIYMPALIKGEGAKLLPEVGPNAAGGGAAQPIRGAKAVGEEWTSQGTSDTAYMGALAKSTSGAALTTADKAALDDMTSMGNRIFKINREARMATGGDFGNALAMGHLSDADLKRGFEVLNGYNRTAEQLFSDPSLHTPADLKANLNSQQLKAMERNKAAVGILEEGLRVKETLIKYGLTVDEMGNMGTSEEWLRAAAASNRMQNVEQALKNEKLQSEIDLNRKKLGTEESQARAARDAISSGTINTIETSYRQIINMATAANGNRVPNAAQIEKLRSENPDIFALHEKMLKLISRDVDARLDNKVIAIDAAKAIDEGGATAAPAGTTPQATNPTPAPVQTATPPSAAVLAYRAKLQKGK